MGAAAGEIVPDKPLAALVAVKDLLSHDSNEYIPAAARRDGGSDLPVVGMAEEAQEEPADGAGRGDGLGRHGRGSGQSYR